MFNKVSTGISFSDDSIDFVKLKKSGGGLSLEDYGREWLPTGAIENGVVKNHEEVSKILQGLKLKEKIKKAWVALPVFEENLLVDFKEIFQTVSISVNSYESEESSIARCVVPNEDMGTYMIVNMGKFRTYFFIISKGAISFTSGLGIGGDTILHVSEENSTKEITLTREMITEVVSSAKISGVSILREEISKYFLYWHSGKDENEKRRPMIDRVVLCGNSAHLKELAEYFSVSLRTKTELANVWTNILNPEENIPAMTRKESFSYASALGTALGGFE